MWAGGVPGSSAEHEQAGWQCIRWAQSLAPAASGGRPRWRKAGPLGTCQSRATSGTSAAPPPSPASSSKPLSESASPHNLSSAVAGCSPCSSEPRTGLQCPSGASRENQVWAISAGPTELVPSGSLPVVSNVHGSQALRTYREPTVHRVKCPRCVTAHNPHNKQRVESGDHH